MLCCALNYCLVICIRDQFESDVISWVIFTGIPPWRNWFDELNSCLMTIRIKIWAIKQRLWRRRWRRQSERLRSVEEVEVDGFGFGQSGARSITLISAPAWKFNVFSLHAIALMRLYFPNRVKIRYRLSTCVFFFIY